MEARIKLKLGDVEIEYEGTEAFFKDELPAILEAISKLRFPQSQQSGPPRPPSPGKPVTGTTAAIAAKVGAKSGSELIMAAAAKLTLVDGVGEFSRDQLHAAMKSATGLYKKSYTNNFGNYLGSLMKAQQLHEVSKDTFSLPQNVRAELEKQLAS